MSDDLSYPSQDDIIEADFERNQSDTSSVLSELSELSAIRLATNPKYAIIWELLQCCQEAAIEDIPERHRGCLSIFNTQHCDQEPVARQKYSSDVEDYDDVFRAAGAIKSSEPWSLPAVARPISDEDALWPPNMQVLSVTEVIPTAALYLTPDAALSDQLQRISGAGASTEAGEATRSYLHNASPLENAKTPLFASAAFTSASQFAHRGENLSFRTLWRYNRLATTSLLRQAHSFHADVPVFGVLLHGSRVAFHIDWYEELDGIIGINSAMYVPVDEMTDSKTWDLQNSTEAAEVKAILSNLRNYTAGPYAVQIQRDLEAFNGPLRPWKWHSSSLPEFVAYSRLHQHIEELPEEKIDRWQESMTKSMDDIFHGGWLRQKLHHGRIAQHGGQKRSRDFLSPPSTPQSLGDLHIID